MLTNNNKNLKIFKDFKTDNNLPKHKKDRKDSGNNFATFTVSGGSNNVDWDTSEDSNNYINTGTTRIKKSWGITNFFKNLGKKKAPELVSPLIFFDQVLKSIAVESFDEELYKKRTAGYLKSIEQAEKVGQIALRDNLRDLLRVVKTESLLFAAGNVTVITEEQVVKFAAKSKKGIKLDWIKNFNRIIPDKVVKKKLEMDELKAFDNYVVMHYDPEGKATSKTKAEREDPILFGVIKDTNKLYFIADWKDKFCDLTLDKFIDEFGNKAIKANNITANVFIA